MTELEKLKERLFGDPKRRLVNFSFTPGPEATPQGVAREINKALDQIEKGDFEIIEQID